MDAYWLTSAVYDHLVEPLVAPLRSVARSVCPPDPTWVVVDVGCGTGTALAEYAAIGCRVIGVDTSAAMLARARERLGPDSDVRLVKGARLPVDDGTADLVLVSLVLHSVPWPEAVGLLAEVRRVLRPSGRALVIDFGCTDLRFPRGHATRALSVVAELAAGPAHARNSWAYQRRGGLPGLLEGSADFELGSARPTAGGNMTVAVLVPRGGDVPAPPDGPAGETPPRG